jgi:hypothetical protein
MNDLCEREMMTRQNGRTLNLKTRTGISYPREVLRNCVSIRPRYPGTLFIYP